MWELCHEPGNKDPVIKQPVFSMETIWAIYVKSLTWTEGRHFGARIPLLNSNLLG